MSGFGARAWSGEAHLWWVEAKPGDTLELAVPVKEAGTYTLKANFTKAVDYGIVQLYLNGAKLGEPIDFYNNGVVPSGVMDLGTRALPAGEQDLKVEIVGANEKAAKGLHVRAGLPVAGEAINFRMGSQPRRTHPTDHEIWIRYFRKIGRFAAMIHS